ncbi:MAG: universal stress protein [Syntrophobacteraceae bacterium]|nr:universal stress protein [Syntrophobacteraceae bacterium]
MSVKKVVFPVDLAGSSYRIASRVRSTVEKLNAELHLVYVMETFKGYDTFFIPHRSLDLMEREDRSLAKRELEEFAEKYFEDFPGVKLVVLRGKPVKQILQYIVSEGIDMVIEASNDRTFLDRKIFGETAEKIARTSPVPVRTINPFEMGKYHLPAPYASHVLASHSH